jgi:allantoin racemase
MRILLANPNTTSAVTDKALGEARRFAGAGTEVDGVTAAFGVAIVSTEAENVVAAHATLDLIATYGTGYDAVVVAMSFDAGVSAARQLFGVPVVGITEAALHTACLAGDRFALVVLGAVSLPLYLDLVDRSGLRVRLAALELVELDSIEAYLDETRLESGIRAAFARLAARSDVSSIILCGAMTTGIARRLQPEFSLPLVDGVSAAVRQVETLVALNLKPRANAARLAARRPTLGLSLALQRSFEAPELRPDFKSPKQG